MANHPRLTLPGGLPNCFTLGRRQTAWLVIDGDGAAAYEPAEVVCRVDPTPLTLPPSIQARRTQISIREAGKMAEGLPAQSNGPLYALRRYAIRRTTAREGLGVTFTFSETDYFTFQATVMSLDLPLAADRQTLRQAYIATDERCVEPIPFLAVGFGVGLAIVTRDNQIALTRRSDTVGARRGELDVSVVEGVHPVLDRSATSTAPDLYHTAVRGAAEELAIDLAPADVRFLGFGVDLQYYQWNMLGCARTGLTAAEILARRSRGASGKWEACRIEFADFELHGLLRLLRDTTIWSSGCCTIYWALVNAFGNEATSRAVADVFDA